MKSEESFGWMSRFGLDTVKRRDRSIMVWAYVKANRVGQDDSLESQQKWNIPA